MNTLVGIIFYTIVVFFVWNLLKRFFFKMIFKRFSFPQKEQEKKQKMEPQMGNIKWDAETVEYEEIKDDDKEK